jgi:hypothetical protein
VAAAEAKGRERRNGKWKIENGEVGKGKRVNVKK